MKLLNRVYSFMKTSMIFINEWNNLFTVTLSTFVFCTLMHPYSFQNKNVHQVMATLLVAMAALLVLLIIIVSMKLSVRPFNLNFCNLYLICITSRPIIFLSKLCIYFLINIKLQWDSRDQIIFTWTLVTFHCDKNNAT